MFLTTHAHGPKWGQKKVAAYMQVSPSTVRFWRDRFKETGDVADAPRLGRPPTISEKNSDILEGLVEKDPRATSVSSLTQKLKAQITWMLALEQ